LSILGFFIWVLVFRYVFYGLIGLCFWSHGLPRTLGRIHTLDGLKDKDLKAVVKAAVEQGWRVEETKKGGCSSHRIRPRGQWPSIRRL